jgi:hypothetical protein
MDKITFTWRGVKYTVSRDVFVNGTVIRLPDGTFLYISSWLNTDPPTPSGIDEIRILDATAVS